MYNLRWDGRWNPSCKGCRPSTLNTAQYCIYADGALVALPNQVSLESSRVAVEQPCIKSWSLKLYGLHNKLAQEAAVRIIHSLQKRTVMYIQHGK